MPWLQEGASEYRALARSMPSGFVALFDSELRILVADGVELATFGFSRQDLEGRLLRDAVPAALAAELEPRYLAALQGERVSWTRDVAGRSFKLTVGPVESEDGVVRSGLLVATDITAERLNERLWEALHAISTDVARLAPLEQVAQDVAAALVDVFGVDNAAIVRFVETGRAQTLAMRPVPLPGVAEELVFSPGDQSAIARVQQTGGPAMTSYVDEVGDVARGLSAAGLRAGAAAPIRIRGELWGAIAVASRRTELSTTLLSRLTGFADLVELAVASTEAWTALSAQATTDELTGLPNRRAFFERLDQEVAQARRHGTPLSVAAMDIDHFKAVNDRFGHPAGDAVLAELGHCMRGVLRAGELAARLGGEEFGWILPHTGGAAAVAAAERLRAAVAATEFPEVADLSITIGVSSLLDAEDAHELLSRADDALYLGKRKGRNRVVRYHVE